MRPIAHLLKKSLVEFGPGRIATRKIPPYPRNNLRYHLIVHRTHFIVHRTKCSEMAPYGEHKIGLNNNACYYNGYFSACPVANSNGNSEAILTLSPRLATGSLSLDDGGYRRLGIPAGIRARQAR
jgi:hypothetical protein